MLDKFKKWFESDSLALPKIIVAVIGVLLLLVIIGGTVDSCRSHVENVGINHADTKADKAEDKALKHEGAADEIGTQADAIDSQRVAAEQSTAVSKGKLAQGRTQLNERKRQYDNAKTNVSTPGVMPLDEYERSVLSKLRALYPGVGFVIGRTKGTTN
jgi:hypothetical protein